MKKKNISMRLGILTIALMFVLFASGTVFAGANIVIVNADGAGEGFNDPTPAAPVGGNTGTTLGQQRLIAFQYAANIWGAELDSNQPIFIQAAFDPLPPNVLGSAGSFFVIRDFPGQALLYPGVEFPATWYGSALADKRAGADQVPGFADIGATFSSSFNFYLGLDNNHGAQPDLVVVLLHEFGHGLNFQNFVNEAAGTNLAGFTDIYARHTLDNTTGLYWDQMTDAQRQASAVNWGNVVWDGASVNSEVPNVLSLGSPEVKVLTPAVIAGTYQFGTAAFGTPVTLLPAPVTGGIIPAVDADEDGAGAAFTTTDGCSPLTNAAAVAGNIALIERGGCGFAVKAKVAQNAGATGVIIYNQAANAAAGPPGMAGVDPTLTIPAVSLRRSDGLAIVANVPATGFIGKDNSIFAGADQFGKARLFMPNPVQGGSSGSHYDSIAFRNLLMEPAINGDLTQNLKSPDDLTVELLTDVGWFPDNDLDGLDNALDACPDSILAATVVIGGNDSGVPNTLFVNGCTISDYIAQIAAASSNHGQFVSGVAHFTNELKKAGIITGKQKGAIQSAAAKANIP